jgi:glycosyltransferase involved in cell wall biosynthesis
MKIGMILDSAFPPDPRVENEAVSLIKNNHEVHLYCFDYSFKLKEYEIINEIHVHRIKIPKLLYSLSALAYTIPAYHKYLEKSLKNFIINNGIEAIHIHDMQIARSVFNINKRFKLPVTIDLHENRPEIMKYYSHVNSFKGKLLISPAIWKKFEFKYIKQADNVIVITEEAKQYYLKQINVPENKFYVVPNTVRKEFYTDYYLDKTIITKYKNNFVMLYLGETGLRRGLATVIKSLKLLTPVIDNLKLVIVGKSKTDHILKKIVKDENLEDYVDFLGWQDVSLFPSFIIASKIGISPLHRNLHHDTTYANKIFQYMAFGKPVVVSDCIAQKNLVNKYQCGLVFKDRDEKDFADKVITLYNSKEKYNLFSKNAEISIKNKLTWEIKSKELIKLYDKFLKNK